MNNENTYDNCLLIIKDKAKLSLIEMNTKYKTFKDKYPRLFGMLTMNDDIDTQMLKFLCDKADEQMKLNSDKSVESKDKQLENEFEVSDTLAKKYLYNKVAPEPSDFQKEQIKEQIKRKLNSESK